jgi:hypothetical protein
MDYAALAGLLRPGMKVLDIHGDRIGPGESVSLMSAPVPEVPGSVTIPAGVRAGAEACVFVARVLGESDAQANLVLLLASELVTNSVRHSGPAVPGGVVTENRGGGR